MCGFRLISLSHVAVLVAITLFMENIRILGELHFRVLSLTAGTCRCTRTYTLPPFLWDAQDGQIRPFSLASLESGDDRGLLPSSFVADEISHPSCHVPLNTPTERHVTYETASSLVGGGWPGEKRKARGVVAGFWRLGRQSHTLSGLAIGPLSRSGVCWTSSMAWLLLSDMTAEMDMEKNPYTLYGCVDPVGRKWMFALCIMGVTEKEQTHEK